LELALSGDAKQVRASFLGWHRILTDSAEKIGSAMQIDGTDVRFRRISRHKEKLHLDFWIGSSDSAAVQLNQPGKAGSENPGTTIAVDGRADGTWCAKAICTAILPPRGSKTRSSPVAPAFTRS